MSLLIHKFNEFFEENCDKLLEYVEEHPIDYDNVNLWISIQQDECSRILALMVKKYLRYVGFEEFNNKLQRLTADIESIIDVYSKHEIPDVILYIPGDLNKSNLWTTMLIYPSLSKYITDIISSENDFDRVSKIKRTIIVHADDMIYSGTQINKSISEFLSYRDRNVNNIFYYICCPFITQYAKTRLEKVFDLYRVNDRDIPGEIIPTFKQQLNYDTVYNLLVDPIDCNFKISKYRESFFTDISEKILT